MVGSVKDVSSKDKPQDKIIKKKKEDFKAVIRRDDGVLQKIGGVSGGGCMAASTTQMQHAFMRGPSLQDSQQLEKPHLLPWS